LTALVQAFLKLTWIELKLFLRDPFTLIFTFAYPFFVLFILSNVFGNEIGNEEDVRVWRGVGPTDYYVPAYIALVIASIGVLALPLRLTTYREQGVLRRFRASALTMWSILGSQLVVALVMAVVGTVSIALAAKLGLGAFWPRDPARVLVAFGFGFLAFGSFGAFLGAVLPNSRSAQAAGLILFFVMFLLSGTGPPREVFSAGMKDISEVLPLTHVVRVIQDPWLGYAWSSTAWLVVAGFTLVSSVLALRYFRWE
jgi:ABC-2 type transport system permease protein